MHFFNIVSRNIYPIDGKKLDMIDADLDVLKTFNDYNNDYNLQFIKLAINKTHPWLGKTVEQLDLAPDALITMMFRDKKPIVPDGKNQISQGDIAVLCAAAFTNDIPVCLKEQKITADSRWANKTISDFSPDAGELVIMIARGERVIIPTGSTIIKENDVLVLNSSALSN